MEAFNKTKCIFNRDIKIPLTLPKNKMPKKTHIKIQENRIGPKNANAS